MSRRPATAFPALPARAHRSSHRPHEHSTESQKLHEELRQAILALPVPAFNILMARLLRSCGYAGVQVLGEARGGADLVAHAPSGLAATRTLVQAKQYRAPVSRRFVDELRGAMLRQGAAQGLLLTTSTFYGPAHAAAHVAARGPALPPVRLVEGEELLVLLIRYGLGVRQAAGKRPLLDHELFVQLRREHGLPEPEAPDPSTSTRGTQPCPVQVPVVELAPEPALQPAPAHGLSCRSS